MGHLPPGRRQRGHLESCAAVRGEQPAHRRDALVIELRVDALLPGPALVHQRAVQPPQRADLQHVLMGIHDSGSRPSASSSRSSRASTAAEVLFPLGATMSRVTDAARIAEIRASLPDNLPPGCEIIVPEEV